MAKNSATASSDVSAARKDLEARATELSKDGIDPHDISVGKLLAPLDSLEPLIAPHEAQLKKRKAGLEYLGAAKEIGAELRTETAGLPEDLRLLRKRPASVFALIASASSLLGAMHKDVRRQARGKTNRELADRFGARSGNTPTELIADIKAFRNAAGDPQVKEAFGIIDEDLESLGSCETKLSALPAEEAKRGTLNGAQIASIVAKQLALEAYYARLSAKAMIVFRELPSEQKTLLELIPRSAAGRAKAVEEDPPATTTSAEGETAAAAKDERPAKKGKQKTQGKDDAKGADQEKAPAEDAVKSPEQAGAQASNAAAMPEA